MSDDPIDTAHGGGGTDLFDPATFHDAGVPDTYETADAFPADGSGIGDGGIGPAEPLVQIAPGVEGRLIDTDAAGTPDAVAVDLDGDGDLDATITRDPAGTFTIGYDDDGDGLADRYETVTTAQLDAVLPGVAAALDPGAHHGGTADTAPRVEDDRVVGDPQEYSQVWFQQAVNGFCMPSSVAQIVSVYTGEPMTDEMAIVQAANQLQLWSVGADGVPGMTSENAVALLEAYGIPVELTHALIGDHALESLDQALADGRGVIITLDSGEVWYGENTEDHVLDHAVVVAGIDHDRGVVLLSDPGSPNGNLEEVPIEVFMDAWADSRYEMITCDEPAAALTDGPGGVDGGAASGEGLDAVFTRPWAMLPVTVTVTVTMSGSGGGA